jgi:hypothetical protein
MTQEWSLNFTQGTPMKPKIAINDVMGSLAIHKQNDGLYTKILSDAGISENDLLAGYYKNDPRGESEDLGVFESCLVAALQNDAEKLNTTITSINCYLSNPDVFTFWKFALLSKFIEDNDLSTDTDLTLFWRALSEYGNDLPTCLAAFEVLNTLVENADITADQYQEGLLTVMACFLSLALDHEDVDTEVSQLIHTIGTNSGINGIYIFDTEYGSGTHMEACRRMLEEFTGVCLEVPDGADSEEDGYLDEVDWDEVSDQVVSNLG